jgi:hypothetical protein
MSSLEIDSSFREPAEKLMIRLEAGVARRFKLERFRTVLKSHLEPAGNARL